MDTIQNQDALRQITSKFVNNYPKDSHSPSKELPSLQTITKETPSAPFEDNLDLQLKQKKSAPDCCQSQPKDTQQEQLYDDENENSEQSSPNRSIKKENKSSENESCSEEQMEILELTSYQFQFSECLPGTVHEKSFNIKLNANLDTPRNIFVYVLCEDEAVNSLPEYVFGVRKQSSYDYYDQFKFKVSKGGEFGFVLGAKTPNLLLNSKQQINCQLYVWLDGLSDKPIKADLKMTIKIPKITCPRELCEDNNTRMIKLCSVKNKPKKDYRVPFKVSQTFKDSRVVTLQTQIMGFDSIQQSKPQRIVDIEVKPRVLNISGEGQFFLNLSLNFTQHIKDQLEQNEGKKIVCCVVRKILVIRIKNSNVMYHFPIEARFYNSNEKVQSTVE